jgi:hypothetical protein
MILCNSKFKKQLQYSNLTGKENVVVQIGEPTSEDDDGIFDKLHPIQRGQSSVWLTSLLFSLTFF